MDEIQLYKRNIAKNGKTAQLVIFMEEASELIKELSKDIRKKGNREDIIEEIADVKVTLDQIELIYECKGEVSAMKKLKQERLKQDL